MFRCHYPDNRRMDEMHMPAAMLYDLQLDQRTFPSIPLTGLVSRNLLYGISEQWSEIWNWVKYKMQWNVNLVEMWSKMKNVIKNKPEAPAPLFPSAPWSKSSASDFRHSMKRDDRPGRPLCTLPASKLKISTHTRIHAMRLLFDSDM